MSARRPPLDGLVVLDLSRVLAGPLATMILADLGARVVKVEDPRGGDATRAWSPPAFDGESAYYLSVNRRKESVAVDLDGDEGREFVRRWAARADVLVENFLPGMLERRGLGVGPLRAANPRLVVCSIAGSPAGDLPGFDLLAQGASGLMAITGPEEGPPHKAGVAVADVLTGWAAVAGILAALQARERDGTGAHVRTDLLSAMTAGLVNVAQSALVTRREPARHGNAHPSIAPYQPFAASDAPFLLAVGTDRQFAALCTEVLGAPKLAGDPRFATNEARVGNRAALEELLAVRFAAGPRAAWLERCRAAGVPAGPVSGVFEALAALPLLVTEREGHAPVPTVPSPILLEGFDLPEPAAPPRLDEDGERLFSEVGLVRGSRSA